MRQGSGVETAEDRGCARGIRAGWAFGMFLLVLLAAFGRLVAEPAGWLVDGQQPSRDEHVRAEDRAVGNDLTRLFLPHHWRIARAVAANGRVPTWDPAGFGGRPLVGNPQAGLWYPPVWVFWATGRPAVLSWLTVGHLALAGAGMVVLCRVLGLGFAASLLGAVAFACGPQVLGHVAEGHLPHVWGVAWYPWAFAGFLTWRRRGWQWGVAVLPPVLAAALLSGHPQEGYYLVVALSLGVAADAVRLARDGDWRAGLGRLGTWGLAMGLVLLLTAPEWRTAAALAPWLHEGTKLTLREASRYHVGLLNVLQLLGPGALGGPADYVGHDNLWETQLGPGWVVLCLALLGLTRWPERRVVRGWGVLVGLAVLFAAGWRFGVFPLFHVLVPGMDHFRVPARSLLLASLGLAVLAAHGVEWLEQGDEAGGRCPGARYLRWAVLAGGLVAAGAMAGPAMLGSSRAALRGLFSGDGSPGDAARVVLACDNLLRSPGFWVAMVGLGAVFLGRGRWRAGVAVGLGVVELGLFGALVIRVSPGERFLGPDPVAEAIRGLTRDGPVRIRARDAFYSDLRAVAAGFEKTNLNDYFQLQQAADLYERLYAMFDAPETRPRFRERAERNAPEVVRGVLERMAVEFVVTDRAIAGAERMGLVPAVRGTWEGRGFNVMRVEGALPRAYVVPRSFVAKDTARLVDTFPGRPRREGVVMAADPLGRGGPRQGFTVASYEQPAPDRVVVWVRTEHPGLLVVADTWMPGWTAEGDGRAAAVERGNRCQRVVALREAGEHVVTMRYEPPGLQGALVMAAAGVGLWGVMAVLAFRGGRRGRPRSGDDEGQIGLMPEAGGLRPF